jgi:CDP-glucose 4,6-dehydratase
MPLDPAFWQGRRVLVTGHTGFKGSWLCAWLARLGAQVTGLALPPPTDPSLFALAGIAALVRSEIGDVREPAVVEATLRAVEPELVFHLAAQPLVLESLRDPLGTFRTNLLGTLNLLEAARRCPTLRAIVVVTSDKCYRDARALCAEDDALGGIEPYSASKACAEIAVGAWRACFLGPSSGVGLATARAGNVIGGGDFGPDRLLPDLIRAARAGTMARLRHPHAVRPWQHVLDAIAGYLTLAEALWWRPAEMAASWNFGPPEEATWTVAAIADEAFRRLGYGAWRSAAGPQRHEAPVLRLSAARARQRLGWRPVLDTEAAVAWAVEGYVELLDRGGRAWLEAQIERHQAQEAEQADALAAPFAASREVIADAQCR